jgi:hypothetical protein
VPARSPPVGEQEAAATERALAAERAAAQQAEARAAEMQAALAAADDRYESALLELLAERSRTPNLQVRRWPAPIKDCRALLLVVRLLLPPPACLSARACTID